MDPIPHDLTLQIAQLVYPHCAVSHIRKLRLLGHVWEEAYQLAMAEEHDGQVNQQHLHLVQPASGGLRPAGFMFDTDQTHRRAIAGLNVEGDFPSLNQAFGANRTPRVLSTAAGILCIHVTDPARIIIWSPVHNHMIEVPIPNGFGVNTQLGLHVEVVDGNAVAPRCTLVMLYRNPAQEVGMVFAGGWLGARVWDSVDQNWMNEEVATLFLGLHAPADVITNGQVIHFQASDASIVTATVNVNDVEYNSFEVPWPARGRAYKLCLHQGQISICWLADYTVLHISARQGNGWVITDIVALEPIINNFRSEFLSSLRHSRNRPPETPRSVIAGAQIVAFYEGILFFRQREGIVRISLPENTAKRLSFGRQAARSPISAFPCCSTYLRLEQ